jgi:imidazolonepropionase-like amidohydrolase
MGDELGTVEKGKIADLLVLDADPLADIGNFRKINMVIKDGEIIDRDALPTVKVLDYDPELPWPY